MFRSHFWQLRCHQKLPFLATFGKKKLPKMATLPSKFCHFWQSLCIVRFFFPILAIHKVSQNWQNLLPKACQKWQLWVLLQTCHNWNICNSSKSSQMTTALVYILPGSICKDSVPIWPFLATLCLVKFCQIRRKVKLVKFFQILAILVWTNNCQCWQKADNNFVSHCFRQHFPWNC